VTSKTLERACIIPDDRLRKACYQYPKISESLMHNPFNKSSRYKPKKISMIGGVRVDKLKDGDINLSNRNPLT
jgi:hypothetical protein